MRIAALKEILGEFNKQNIQYCILRNYEFLLGQPYPVESLDTVIAKKDLRRAESILFSYGFHKRKQQFSKKHKAYFKLIGLQKISFDVQVGGVYWNDLKYLDENIIRNRQKKSFFYIPSDNDYFIMLLTHSILGKRYFKPKYQKILLSLNVDEDYVRKHLVLDKSLISKVKQNKFSEINCKKIAKGFIFKNPRNTFIFSFLTLRWFWQRKFPKPYPLVSIVGPDGSGKTSLTANLNSFLQEKGRKTVQIYTGRGRGNVLPLMKLGRRYKRAEKKKDKISKVKKANWKRKLLYTFSAPIFTLDLFLRYYLKIFPQRMKKKIVITDRYCSDIVLMKNTPFFFKRFLLALFPKPTLVYFLHNDSQVLHQRRPEEPVEELDRQLGLFRRFKYDLAVKSNDKVKDTEKVLEHVFTYLLKNWF